MCLARRPQTWGHQHLSLNSHRRGIPVRSIDRFDTRTVGENGHEMSQGETSPAPPQKVPADPPVLLPPRSGTAVKNVDRDTQSLVMGGGGKRGEGLHGMLRAEGGGAGEGSFATAAGRIGTPQRAPVVCARPLIFASERPLALSSMPIVAPTSVEKGQREVQLRALADHKCVRGHHSLTPAVVTRPHCPTPPPAPNT